MSHSAVLPQSKARRAHFPYDANVGVQGSVGVEQACVDGCYHPCGDQAAGSAGAV
jgi:hypothetical protein